MADSEFDAEINFTGDTTEFEAAGKKVTRELTKIKQVSQGVGKELSKALKGAIVDGKSFEDTLKNIALQMSRIALDMARQPIENAVASLANDLFGSLAGTGARQSGASQAAGAWLPESAKLARGGVFNTPTLFSGTSGEAGGGIGVMAEAGPEAVLPLQRGSDGRLGVQATGVAAGGAAAAAAVAPVNVTFNISTPDVDGFRKSQAQIASLLARTVNRGRRNL
ncbi:MAG: phage tail tape measure protein [Rhizobiaceae bacterium]|nr:phage tail tape measure protein [Hyphomicrobiales bacterium]NRB31542.1 phage tail tape measure protein [Rhizobiaceae bacterium]